MTVVLFHSNECDLDPNCDGECLYVRQPLCDVPYPTTDEMLDHQWTAACDYAYRMGAQVADLLLLSHVPLWPYSLAWVTFLKQWDNTCRDQLGSIYRLGYHYVRDGHAQANGSSQPIQVV